jgi:hypothetical protein
VKRKQVHQGAQRYTFIDIRPVDMRSDAVINSICSSDGLALLTVEEQQREHEALNALIVWIFGSKRGVRRQRQ